MTESSKHLTAGLIIFLFTVFSLLFFFNSRTTGVQALSDNTPAIYSGYIVEFKNAPAQNQINSLSTQDLNSIQIINNSQQIKSVINSASIKSSLQKDINPTRIFKNNFNGAVYQISDQEAEKLKANSNVLAVYKNYQVKAALNFSVPALKVNQLWSQSLPNTVCKPDGITGCINGKGVTIGIIDTGIDYTHPDLGGCLGTNCKVKGGIDIINKDSNPMDDMGHGTHVAAIIASSNAIYKGIAPQASLYAIKVLDNSGAGWTSDVITGIEWATDPNQDGNTADHLDIINMSLGGQGDANDLVSRAVDSASKVGITVVVAAGNGGAQLNAIGSPASARTAITVAAADLTTRIADFSSRGPGHAGTATLLKPDVSAPGVSICAASTYTGYSIGWTSCGSDSTMHKLLSGTSMATPHVAGVAALLKQYDKTLSPAEIKSLLKNTAVANTKFGFLEQGSGFINPVNAFAALKKKSGAIDSINLDPITVDPNLVTVKISGSSKITFTSPYKVDLAFYKTEDNPLGISTWSTVAAGNAMPASGILATFYTTKMANGNYIVRLSVTGNNSEFPVLNEYNTFKVTNGLGYSPTPTPPANSAPSPTPKPIYIFLTSKITLEKQYTQFAALNLKVIANTNNSVTSVKNSSNLDGKIAFGFNLPKYDKYTFYLKPNGFLSQKASINITGPGENVILPTFTTPFTVGDLNNDDQIDQADLTILRANLKKTAQPLTSGDLNQDYVIDSKDETILLGKLGKTGQYKQDKGATW